MIWTGTEKYVFWVGNLIWIRKACTFYDQLGKFVENISCPTILIEF